MITWLRGLFNRHRHETYRVFLSVSNTKEMCLGVVIATNDKELHDKAGVVITSYLWSAHVFDGGFPIRIKYRWERAFT